MSNESPDQDVTPETQPEDSSDPNAGIPERVFVQEGKEISDTKLLENNELSGA